MTAKHTESENTPSIIPNGIKINLSPKVILCIALLVGGGAGGATIGKLFGVDTEAITGNTKEQFEKNNLDREEDLLRINTTLDKHTDQITEMDTQITEIQVTQHGDIARREARRVTENIEPRQKREEEYDRMVVKNILRLKEHKEPCGTVACEN
jgi:hypothetical protein